MTVLMKGVFIAIALITVGFLLPCVIEQAGASELRQIMRKHGKLKVLEPLNMNTDDDGKKVVMAAEVLHREHPSSPFKSPEGISAEEQAKATLRRSALHVKNRGLSLQTSQLDIEGNAKGLVIHGLQANSMEYFMKMEVGTPRPTSFLFMLDTAASLSWLHCTDGLNDGATGTFYNGSLSPSFQPLPCPSPSCDAIPVSEGCNKKGQCTFSVHYADGSAIKGILAKEMFTLDRKPLQETLFGCVEEALHLPDGPGRGLLGLGANFFSLPSHMNANLFFCLPPFPYGRHPSESATRGMAGLGDLELTLPNTVFTTLIHSPAHDSFHMVPLVGMSIDGQRLPGLNASSFTDPRSTSVRGVFLDSGAVMAYLLHPAYNIFSNAFRNAARARRLREITLDDDEEDAPKVCYGFGSVYEHPTVHNTPSVELHFEGVDASILLLPHNVFFPYKPNLGVYCLAFDVAPLSISSLGNVQLASFLVSIDTKEMRVGFTPNAC